MEQLDIFRPENGTTLAIPTLSEKVRTDLLLSMSQLLLDLVHAHDENSKGDIDDES
jgi:hypothetical protein